jgi:parvulin-like peptidyl-prolyl isomerase
VHLVGATVLPAACGVAAVAADETAPRTSAASDRLLATVGKNTIHERHVRREIDEAMAERRLPTTEETRRALARPTLEVLIDRALVLDALLRESRAASDAAVDTEIRKLRAELDRRKLSFDEYLRTAGLTNDDLRDDTQWRLSWRQLVETELTDAAIVDYFERRRRHFDGTTLRVSHILLARPKEAGDAWQRDALDRAAKLRARIAADELAFADAAKQLSDAPSKSNGGDIGFITRRGEQHEAFAAAAFALDVGELSPPTVTPHGVHLIRCAEVKQGQKQLADVKDEVRRAAATQLFRTWADRERRTAKIEYAPEAR